MPIVRRRSWKQRIKRVVLTMVLVLAADLSGLYLTLGSRLPGMGSSPWHPVSTSGAPLWETPEASSRPAGAYFAPAQSRAEAPSSPPSPPSVHAVRARCSSIVWASAEHARLGKVSEWEWRSHRMRSQGLSEHLAVDCAQFRALRQVRKDMDMAHSVSRLATARASLERALLSTGLAGLHVRWEDEFDAAALDRLASSLRIFNAEISQKTGWEGPVLGLGGQVVLSLDRSHVEGRVADTWMDKANLIHITSAPSSLAHEWFHALDFAMASQMPHPLARPLSRQMIRWDFPNGHPLLQLWTTLEQPSWSTQERTQVHQQAHAMMQAAQQRFSTQDPSGAWVTILARHHPVATMLTSKEGWPVPSHSPWLAWNRAEKACDLAGLPACQKASWLDAAVQLVPSWWRATPSLRPWNPTEAMAEAFQMQFQSSEFSWLADQEVPLPTRSPTAIERQWQQQAFHRFFNDALPWLTDRHLRPRPDLATPGILL